MEGLIALLVLVGLVALILPIALSVANLGRIRALEAAIKKMSERMGALETNRASEVIAKEPASATAPPAPVAPQPATDAPPPPRATPPPLPDSITKPSPAPLPTPTLTTPVPAAPKPARRAIDWEAFMGVKLFAWIGGFVFFLGVVFLVKYSFENNLITPRMRIAMGAIIGLGLIAAGWRAAKKNYRAPGQSLCATGILVLYADIFAAQAFYNLIPLSLAFALMSCVTIAAFFLAVVLNAQVVVILGLLGGFLTPILLSTGQDNPLGLFGYIALLNLGIGAVVLRKRWDHLLPLAALGTVSMEFAWVGHFFHSAKATTAFIVFLAFELQFLLLFFLRRKNSASPKWAAWATALCGFAALLFAAWILGDYPGLARRAGFLFSFIFAADLGLVVLAIVSGFLFFGEIAGMAVFGLLAGWTAGFLDASVLWWGLGSYVVFALLHAGFAAWPRAAPAPKSSWRLQSLIPLLPLVLIWLCVWHDQDSGAVWLSVFLINIVVLGLALRSSSAPLIVIALLCTLVAAGLWIETGSARIEDLDAFLGVSAGVGIFFFAAGMFLARRLTSGTEPSRRVIPALGAAMPFALLLMVVAKLPVLSPTPILAVAFLLSALLLGLAIVSRMSWIAAAALIGSWSVECAWHQLHFSAINPAIPFGWYVIFALLFIGYAFFARNGEQLPWAISAVAGALHFWLIYELVSSAYPHLQNGLLPAVFIIPYACGIFYLIKRQGIAPASGDARLAWQGGAALLFLTLIFPIQFDREWITLGWALEGLALIWLFGKIPHRGLRLVGAGLLCLAFVRLALNPAVLEYHKRSGVKIWNWFLYAYGIASVCSLLGGWLFPPPHQTVLERIARPVLYSLGTVLVFLLLNIEIADYFSIGPTLTFSFSGNFARDMSYSIAWALFAFALLLIGMRQKTGAIRYAALGLLLVTLAKLFLHDLGNLNQLYRIGAFIGVALILIVASFLYQRFLTPAARPKNTP
jgi:uncharacterized membrane protein